MKGIFGLFTYFSQLDRDGSGYLEKDEIECKYPLTSGLLTVLLPVSARHTSD